FFLTLTHENRCCCRRMRTGEQYRSSRPDKMLRDIGLAAIRSQIGRAMKIWRVFPLFLWRSFCRSGAVPRVRATSPLQGFLMDQLGSGYPLLGFSERECRADSRKYFCVPVDRCLGKEKGPVIPSCSIVLHQVFS